MDRSLLPPLSTVWHAFAQEIGARYEPGDFWSGERIVATRGRCVVTIAQETVGPGVASLPVTAWRARTAIPTDACLFVSRADVTPGPLVDGRRYRVEGCDTLLSLPWVREAMASDDLLSISVARYDTVIIVAGTVWRPERLLFYTEMTLGLLDSRDATASAPDGAGSPPRRAREER